MSNTAFHLAACHLTDDIKFAQRDTVGAKAFSISNLLVLSVPSKVSTVKLVGYLSAAQLCAQFTKVDMFFVPASTSMHGLSFSLKISLDKIFAFLPRVRGEDRYHSNVCALCVDLEPGGD